MRELGGQREKISNQINMVKYFLSSSRIQLSLN
jgi:hypothetical protein